jgi:prophage antirepressor-like protein
MNEIQIFKNQEFGAIRTMSNEQGDVMFCAKDVCGALGYNNSREALRKHVNGDDVTKRDTVDSLGRKNFASFINESGLYALILSSKLESARRFKHWVTSEVLPSIRKQGGYIAARPNESDEEILARALQIMQATLQRRDEQIARLKPRAEYADHVLDSIFKVTAQSDVFSVSSQKAAGGQISKCNIVLRELGGKYENTYLATMLGEQANIRFVKDDLVVAALRFSTREYNGQVFQDIVVNEIIKINK